MRTRVIAANPCRYVLLPRPVAPDFVASPAVAGGLALDSEDTADTAAERTKAPAEEGTKPPQYFGVEPSWTCVRTYRP
ncbi:hypothetical protein [Streptomyces milbemycinicus]|uniref:Uncharacterized protein n=1 Tax=Streptomyces milbemycinicus TaxID=476552 RepID=A0ABW8M607_9ACTN